MSLHELLHFVCHQKPDRSFLWLWDPPLLCARCTGIYLGIFLGAVTLFILPVFWATRTRKLLFFFSAVMLIQVGAEEIFGLDPGNFVRFLTGILLGTVLGAGIFAPARSLIYRITDKNKLGGHI